VKIVLAGGGTGGHIAPALAVADALREAVPGLAVGFVATPRAVDREMYSPFSDAVRVLNPPRIDRGLLGKLLLPVTSAIAVARASSLLGEMNPSAILATGGYSSFFCAIAGWLRGIPVLLHESNAIPGKANRLAGFFARRVLVGFESAGRAFGGKAVVTGNPVRASLKRMDRGEAGRLLGLDPSKSTVLVLGGSQGARTLNDLALSAPAGLQIVLQCGEKDYERASSKAKGRPGFLVIPFAGDPAPIYSAADLAIARAGAMTLTELCHFGLPSILVPYPFAADDHQTANAVAAASSGGAIVLSEADLSADLVWALVSELLADPARRSRMSLALSGVFPQESAMTIAKLLLEEARAGGRP
jgi:UDP-N-acetylglucosamine--N-acetylmuramyl-(pentapeptide) pyrophosphoryl-undecaprenol N-acetylglucosamine transferase